ncbi:MAG: hypothetical protein AAFO07_04255 [Bacteroidota bacterium]
MAQVISIDATAQGLNQFSKKVSPKLHSKLRQELEWETFVPFVEADYAYSGEEMEVSDLTQPYQAQFTPNNQESYGGIDNFLRPIKIDTIYTAAQLEKFFSRYRANWFQTDPEKIRNGYFSYILNQIILPKAIEELNDIAWKGEYVAPTAGTPGAVLESCDGFRKFIADQVTAGNLTPLVTGAWPTTFTIGNGTIIDYIREACKLIPEPYRYRPGLIHMSKTKAQLYSDDYRDKYQKSVEVPSKSESGLLLKVDDFKKMIVGHTSMEGDDRIIFTFNNESGLTIGTRIGHPRYYNFRFEAEDRTLKVFSEIYRFYGAETLKHTFVSDQV